MDTYICEACGKKVIEQLTEEHHKVHRALGGNDMKSNLTKICIECHKLVHVIFKNMIKRKPLGDSYNRDLIKKMGRSDRAVQIIIELAHEAYKEFLKRDCKLGGKALKSLNLQFTESNLKLVLVAAERAGYKSAKQWVAALIVKNAGIR
jgi:hypothetical protein